MSDLSIKSCASIEKLKGWATLWSYNNSKKLEGKKECGTSQIISKPKKYWMHFGFKMLVRPNIRWCKQMKSKYYRFKLGGDNITTSHSLIFKYLLGYSKLDLTSPK
jgi:hypothetical protein